MNLMLKSFFSVLCLSSVSLYAQNFNNYTINKNAFVLPKGKVQIKSAYLKVNDTIDVLNLKAKELGSSLSSLGGIGDMDGYDLELRYGLTNRDSIFINYQRWNIDYGDSTLKNNKIDIFNRYNLYSNKGSFLDSISIDIGYEMNKATPIDIKNDTALNSMIKKLKPDTAIKLDDGTIIANDTTFAVYDSVGNKIHPYLSIGNLQSDSYYMRLLFGKEIFTNSFLNLYIDYRLIDIKTKIIFYPNDNKFINSMMGKFTIPNMNRKESVIKSGFTYSLEIYDFIAELNYEYSKIFRDSDISYNDVNHVFDASLSRKITDNFLLYIGGSLMLNQFNTDLPYLYNKYTKTQFDKKYGYAKLGIIYSF